jgi:hypothetical protein
MMSGAGPKDPSTAAAQQGRCAWHVKYAEWIAAGRPLLMDANESDWCYTGHGS